MTTSKIVEEEISFITIPFGPQHPASGHFHAKVKCDGEKVIDLTPYPGYLHRGFEKLMEYRTHVQNIVLSDRKRLRILLLLLHVLEAVKEGLETRNNSGVGRMFIDLELEIRKFAEGLPHIVRNKRIGSTLKVGDIDRVKIRMLLDKT